MPGEWEDVPASDSGWEDVPGPLAETARAAWEVPAAIGSGLVGQAAGAFVKATTPTEFPGLERRSSAPPITGEQVQSALTYQPRGRYAQNVMSVLGAPGELIQKGAKGAAEYLAPNSPMGQEMIEKSIEVIPYGIGRLPKVQKVLTPAEKLGKLQIEQAKAAGYRLTPVEGGGGPISKTAASFAGEPRLNRILSNKNAKLAKERLTGELGIQKGQPVDMDSLLKIRETAGKTYEEARNLGSVQLSDAYRDSIRKIAAEYGGVAYDIPELVRADVQKVTNALVRPAAISSDSIVSLMNQFQRSGKEAWAAQNTTMANVYGKAQQALAGELARRAGEVGNVGLKDRLLDARTTIAKSYDLQNAMNMASGELNPQFYARKAAKGKPLTGAAKEVGETAARFEQSMKKPSHLGSGLTLFDIFHGGLWSHLLRPALGATGEAALGLATGLSRPAMRHLLASKMGQRMIGAEVPVGRPAMIGAQAAQPLDIQEEAQP